MQEKALGLITVTISFFYQLPLTSYLNFFGIHVFLILSAVFCGLVWGFCTQTTFICTNEATEQASSCKVTVFLSLSFLMQHFPGMLTNKWSFYQSVGCAEANRKISDLTWPQKGAQMHVYSSVHGKRSILGQCVTAHIFSCTFLWEHFKTQVWKILPLFAAHHITEMISAPAWIYPSFAPSSEFLTALWWHQLSVSIKHLLAGKFETPFVVSSLDFNLH